MTEREPYCCMDCRLYFGKKPMELNCPECGSKDIKPLEEVAAA